jgi:hypothetical protein
MFTDKPVSALVNMEFMYGKTSDGSACLFQREYSSHQYVSVPDFEGSPGGDPPLPGAAGFLAVA